MGQSVVGSTSGGVKIARWVILVKAVWNGLLRRITPSIVTTVRIDGKNLPKEATGNVLAFFFLYVLFFALSSVVMTLLMPHQSFVTSLSAVAATVNNVGPGLGEVGPTMNFATQSGAAKLFLCFVMVAGRLEFVPILALFSRRLWSTA